MKSTTQNAVIIGGSALFGLAVVNGIFWTLSVNQPGLISAFSAMIAASLSHSLTKRYVKS